MNIRETDTHEAKLLVIENEGDAGDFDRKMICHVKDPLFLPAAGPFAKALCEGGFAYDISGLETMEQALGNRVLSSGDILSVTISLNNAILVLEAHLLSDANLLLSPDRIYVRTGPAEPVFCPAFSSEESFEERLRPLIREIFLHADTSDPDTLRLASELLKVSLRKHYRMHDLMAVLENETGKKKTPLPGLLIPEHDPEKHASLRGPACEKEKDVFPVWPEEEEETGGLFSRKQGTDPRKENGVFGRLKSAASAALAWVRGDDEITSGDMIVFEDHT